MRKQFIPAVAVALLAESAIAARSVSRSMPVRFFLLKRTFHLGTPRIWPIFS